MARQEIFTGALASDWSASGFMWGELDAGRRAVDNRTFML